MGFTCTKMVTGNVTMSLRSTSHVGNLQITVIKVSPRLLYVQKIVWPTSVLFWFTLIALFFRQKGSNMNKAEHSAAKEPDITTRSL